MLKPDPRTCGWLLNNTTFIDWLKSQNGFLWIRGNPGCGKSMAMKQTLLHLQDRIEPQGLLIHFFFHGQGRDLQKSSLGLYLSLLHQVYPYLPDCFLDLTDRFDEYKQKGPADWRWMKGEIRQLFLKGILHASQRSSIILLVDALDEAGEREAKVIVDDLRSLTNTSENKEVRIRICFSCRHYPQIILSDSETLVMDEINLEDIRTVVASRIDSATCFDASEKYRLKNEILSKAAGSFQWACLVSEVVIDTREKGDSFKIALKTIKTAPKALESLYKSLLDAKHEPRHDKQRQQMLKLFQWVTFSAKPLTLEELQHALALDCNMPEKSILEYQQGDNFIALGDLETKVKNLSRGLIRVIHSNRTAYHQVGFIHQSVSDFFVHRGLQLFNTDPGVDVLRRAHFQLSRSCLRYLLMSEIRGERHPNRMTQHRNFVSYACNYWIFHASHATLRDGSTADESDNDLVGLLEWPHDEALLSDWKKLQGCPIYELQSLRPSFSLASGYPALYWPCRGSRLVHLLAMLGLRSLLQSLAAQRHSTLPRASWINQFDVKDEYGMTPLAYALFGRQKETVRFLIGAGAKPYSEGGSSFNSPLVLALRSRDPEIIQLVLAGGADPNTPIGRNYALHIAIEHNDEAAVRILLDKSANVHERTCHGLTPLQLALFFGKNNFKIAEMLLDYGANPSDWSPSSETPLRVAIEADLGFLIEKMVGRGLNVNSRDKNGLTPLHYALDHSRKTSKAAAMLLDLGADPNAQIEWEEVAPLHLAARRNDASAVALLIQKGALLDTKDRFGRTPLHIALEQGDLEVIERFTSAGCDIKARSNWLLGEKTPLHLAAKNPHGAVVSWLIQEMANVHAKCLMGTTPLHRAETSETAQRLIEAGADIESRDKSGCTPLHWAARGRNADVVAILLQNGADANATDCSGKTPLHEAETAEIVSRLIEIGANIESRDQWGCTPLHDAARDRKKEVVAELLQRGADADAKDYEGIPARLTSMI